ncbi:MAG: SHOCT domain-containing protein [Culicoidibacterales bacterium]
MKECSMCRDKIGIFNKRILPNEDGWKYIHPQDIERYNLVVCSKCYKIEYPKIKKAYEQDLQKRKEFKSTRNIENIIEINEENNTFRRLKPRDFELEIANVIKMFGRQTSDKVYELENVRSYELMDNNTVLSSGGFGSAVVGGAVFGGAGAVTGAIIGKKNKNMSHLKIKLFLNDIDNPVIYISISDKPVAKNSSAYDKQLKIADIIISTFDILFAKINNDQLSNLHQESVTSINNLEESIKLNEIEKFDNDVEVLKKFKFLLDEGIITQEEFDIKKRQILKI